MPQQKLPPGTHTHICPEIQKTIDNHTHEPDLKLYFEEDCEEDPELDFWTIYDDGESTYFRIYYCPWCGVKLTDPRI
jgi:hypothetical protein